MIKALLTTYLDLRVKRKRFFLFTIYNFAYICNQIHSVTL